MIQPTSDDRSDDLRRHDEIIAGAARLPIPQLGPDAIPQPLEAFLPAAAQKPRALLGIVENGLIRPLDAAAALVEHSRVIIVAAENL